MHRYSCSLMFLLLAVQTADGQPDLQGTWDFGTKTPFQRPAELAEKRAYTGQEAMDIENKACHEGNYAMPGILAGARKEEAAAARKVHVPSTTH